ncbi:hypothetical protein, partial [Arenibacter sp. F20364]|uniref:hypothetical protein n=1 Tax=Arenibacter sp. F20364 TaxID=2926415 RepID=UPI001FF0E502
MKINTLHNLLSKFLVAYKLKFLVLASTLLFFGFNGYGQVPTGYSVSIDQDPINAGNQMAVSFTFTGATVGTTYNYS